MTTPAIPAHDAEKLDRMAGQARRANDVHSAVVFVLQEAYALGRTNALTNLETALRELGAHSFMAGVPIAPGDPWLASVDADGLRDAVARSGDSIEAALLAAIEAVNGERLLSSKAGG